MEDDLSGDPKLSFFPVGSVAEALVICTVTYNGAKCSIVEC